MSAPASVPRVARPSEATTFARSAHFTDIIFFMLSAIATVMYSALVKILPPQQSVLLVPSTGCLSGGLSSVSFWWQMKGVLLGADAVVPFRKQMKGVRPVEYAVGPPGGLCGLSFLGQMYGILPGTDA